MQVMFKLLDDLVEQARAAGLLTDERIAEWLQSELRRADALKRFNAIADVLATAGMTEAEIEAELVHGSPQV